MRYRTHGFTLVEILVVISIIGILVSLTLTYVGTAKQTARRAECVNNLRQITFAAIDYELSQGRLPGYCKKFGQFAGGVDPSDPGSYSGSVPAHVKVGTWQVSLLSKLDSQPIFEVWTQDRYPLLSDGAGERTSTPEGYSRIASPNLRIFECPSASGSIALHGRNQYIANTGMHADVFPFTYTRPAGPPRTVDFAGSMDRQNAAFNNRYGGYDPSDPSLLVAVGGPITLDDFKDGLSNTMLLSESNQAQPWYLTSLSGNTVHLTTFVTSGAEMVSQYPAQSRYLQGAVWHFEDPMNVAGAATPLAVHRINGGDVYNEQMNATNLSDLARPSSLHHDGVNMGFGDGSVRFVVDSIDYRTYQWLMTPAGKSSDVPFNEFIPISEL